MRALWPTVLSSLFETCRPALVVELGPPDSGLTPLLAEAAAHHGGRVLRDLPEEAEVDVAILHGLGGRTETAASLNRLRPVKPGAPFPLTVVHGVDATPASDEVLVAVEEFVRESDGELEFVHVPGLGGAAILIARALFAAPGETALGRLLDDWRMSPQALGQLGAVDAARIKAAARVEELSTELRASRGELEAKLTAERDALRDAVRALADRESGHIAAAARREARPATLDAPATDTEIGPGTSAITQLIRISAAPSFADRRGALTDGNGAAQSRLHVIVRAQGDADALRLCLWSLLARAGRGLSVSLVVGARPGAALRSTAQAFAAENPAAVIVSELPPDDVSSWRLLIEEPVTFGERTVAALAAAAEGTGSPAAVAAVGVAELGLPAWAAEAAALLNGGETREISGSAGPPAAACTIFAPGIARGEPTRLAPGGVVSRGGPALRSQPDARPRAGLRDEEELAASLRERLRDPLAVSYVLPGLPRGGSGGSHSVIQEAGALRRMGVPTKVLVEEEFSARARSVYPEAADLLVHYADANELELLLADSDVVVATEAPSAHLVSTYARAHPAVLGAYYVQDYEPLFSPEGGPRADAALLSYRRAEGLLLFAKTHWVVNVVGAAHHLPVAKVPPSLDRSIFNARGRTEDVRNPRVLAMVRPRTPRRRATETLAVLGRLKERFGDGVECFSCGCGEAELDGMHAARGVQHLGVLSRREVADALRRSDLFLDLSSYQAFGRMGLEAMACGATPLLPVRGGVAEYAVDGHNALLVDTENEEAVLDAAAGVLSDRGRLERMRGAGVESAARFTLIGAAAAQYGCFASRHPRTQAGPASPALRGEGRAESR